MTTATSQVEKHFQMHNIYKRSKNYYDVQRMKQEQHMQQIYRRKPNYSIETLDTRVDQSFVNSSEAANKKLQHDISSFKKRYQDDKSQAFTSSDTINKYQTQEEENYENRKSKTKIKAPDLMKMSARKTFQLSRVAYNNQNQFNNFTLNSPRSKAHLNFDLSSPRSKSSIDNPQKKKQIDSLVIGKVQEKNNFNQSIYKCLFEYSKVGKYAEHSRKDKTMTNFRQIDHDKLTRAEKSVQVNPIVGQCQFYLSVGKQSPTQMNMRYNKNNEFYFKNLSARKQKQDYSQQKLKQDMIQKRLNQIRKKKQVIDTRYDLCDYKFFNRASYRHKQ